MEADAAENLSGVEIEVEITDTSHDDDDDEDDEEDEDEDEDESEEDGGMGNDPRRPIYSMETLGIEALVC